MTSKVTAFVRSGVLSSGHSTCRARGKVSNLQKCVSAPQATLGVQAPGVLPAPASTEPRSLLAKGSSGPPGTAGAGSLGPPWTRSMKIPVTETLPARLGEASGGEVRGPGRRSGEEGAPSRPAPPQSAPHNGALEVAGTRVVIDFWDQDISQFETRFKKKNRCSTFSGVWLKREK